jgi:nicotinate-nucleotide pyrophosphorylase (carboxylating)
MNTAAELAEKEKIRELIKNALDEDLAGGDVTTNSIVPEDQRMKGVLIAKEEGIIAGLYAAKEVFLTLDGTTKFSLMATEGIKVSRGQIIARIEGPACAILSAERTALNILQRMSGIATETRKFADAVSGTSCVILDTRKTVPGLRVLDKQAVKTGGGENHRFGLYDMVMIKDNHITSAESITEAVRRVRKKTPEDMKIEVEVKNRKELLEAVNLKVDRILLDNMTTKEMSDAAELVKGCVPLEASGNITIDRVPEIAAAGIDYISVGSLTHSVRALDISLLLESPGVSL